MIIYTSGTTGRPKGVVTTHANIAAQIASLVAAWGWTSRDRFLLALPLHHVHGIINGLATTLAVGGTCEMLPAFDAERVWDRLASGDITVFTAVPTVYYRLIDAWDRAPDAVKRRRSEGARTLRLMMSGLIGPPAERARAMARDHRPHAPGALRHDGDRHDPRRIRSTANGARGRLACRFPTWTCGSSMPRALTVPLGTPGEIEVRGPSVFLEYLAPAGGDPRGLPRRLVPHRRRRPPRGRSLPAAGTGERGHHQDGRLQGVGARDRGRAAASSRHLRLCRDRRARFGVGRTRVGGGGTARGLDAALEDLRQWAGTQLAPYKVPTALRVVDLLPRNAMGKVTKSDVKRLF